MGFALVLYSNCSSAATVQSSEIDVDNNTFHNISLNDNNISYDKNSTGNSKKETLDNGLIKQNVATSNNELNTNKGTDISLNLFKSNITSNYLKYITFTIFVYNNGPETAQNIIVLDRFNSYFLKYISDDGNGAYNYKTGVWYVGTLYNNTSSTLHVVEEIVRSNSTIINSAIYQSSLQIDPNPSNNQSEISFFVPSAADISLTQTASNHYPIYLHYNTFTITVKNNGPNSATNVIVRCLLNPKLFKYISDDSKGFYNYKTGVWNISTLNCGYKIIIHIKTKIMIFRTSVNKKYFSNLIYTKSDTYDTSLKYNKAISVFGVPRITLKSLVSSLSYGISSRYVKAVNIFNWVRDNIDYSFYYNTKYGAVRTLKYRTGNCCDISNLLVTLSRYAGIKARFIHGICYFSDRTWCGHVWTQIFVYGRWYTTDAINHKNSFGVINNWNTKTYKLKGVYKTLPF